MHPTISQMLVQDRHASLHAEAETARLGSIARTHLRTAGLSASAKGDDARPGVIRRVVHRLVPA